MSQYLLFQLKKVHAQCCTRPRVCLTTYATYPFLPRLHPAATLPFKLEISSEAYLKVEG